MLLERQLLGPADAKCPSQLLHTLLWAKRKRKKRQMTRTMLALRRTPFGKRYCELQRQIPGAVLATKNHQGGLNDKQDESDGKMFEVPGSPRCPVQNRGKFYQPLECEDGIPLPETEAGKQQVQSLSGHGLVL